MDEAAFARWLGMMWVGCLGALVAALPRSAAWQSAPTVGLACRGRLVSCMNLMAEPHAGITGMAEAAFARWPGIMWVAVLCAGRGFAAKCRSAIGTYSGPRLPGEAFAAGEACFLHELDG
jgi:hypothetical protein